ncbi:hypothetical protein [Scleromatobacter humisilvae]|uniref:Porin domain-containing protein n=1 Tax=Scleromatobacter humisilvae TaxID=2897159 RepID=A0A9X1YGY6_9BURK|nr:hypothetical protein [Scleromatobacter humisilvae]MCK9684655.1 hypothetical protein [Scleromatobacter humisilvae]
MTPRTLARLQRATWLAASFAALSSTASAQDATGSSDFRLNGFGTLGLVDVLPHDSWGFRREIDQTEHHDQHLRADVDSRLGLQASWRLDPQFELVGQLVLKPRAHEAADDESLAEAFAAWRPAPEWEIRAGRTSPDLFLLADVRNVGFAYPWMRPSVDFYGWMPASTLDGADVSRQWLLGDGRLRAKIFAGKTSVTLGANQPDTTDDHGNVHPLLGSTLAFDAGGLTIKATVAEAHTRSRNFDNVIQAYNGLDQLARLPVPVVSTQAAQLRDSFSSHTFVTRYAALGVSWDMSPWQMQAELSRITGNFESSSAWYGYASLARRIDDVTLFTMVGRARSSRAPLPQPQWTGALAPVVGPVLAQQAQTLGTDIAGQYNSGRENEGTLTVGSRWDINAQVALKAQLDVVRSAAYGGGLWGFNTPAAHHASVLSAGMDFVF